jgi:AraC-like DNA-binding protein
MDQLPCEALRPWVAGYSIAESDGSAGVHDVLPGLQPVLGFQYRGRMSTLRDGGETLLETSGITGLQSERRLFRALPGAATLLVRFHPWGASAFLPGPMEELADRSIGLSALINPALTRRVEEQLAEGRDDSQRIRVVEGFLLALLRSRLPDGHVRKAVRLLQADPSLDLPGVAQKLGLGERQMERKFREWIGVGPKRFARLSRFQRVINILEKDPGALHTALAQGFYDQAHFIKDFRAFAGTTPEAWLAGLRQDVGNLQWGPAAGT